MRRARTQIIIHISLILAQGYEKISCSTQLSMKFFLLISVKMTTVVGILTLMSRENSILGLFDPEKS